MHQDEMGAPHFHLHRTWPCKDEETGLTTTDQTKALLKAGVLPPDPEKKISKKNNPKMTFDKMCREKRILQLALMTLRLKIRQSQGMKSERLLRNFKKSKISCAIGFSLSFLHWLKRTLMFLKKYPSGMNLCQVFRTLRNEPRSAVGCPENLTGWTAWSDSWFICCCLCKIE